MSQSLSNKLCRSCGRLLEVRKTIRTAEQLLKSYYYTAYYYCARCRKMYHSDEFRVYNKNQSLFSTPEASLTHPVDIEIWTDGACKNNGQLFAKAAWAFATHDFEASGLVPGKQTNNRAEAYAILEALRWAGKNGYKRVKILSDSQLSLNNLKTHPSHIKMNREIFEEIDTLIRDYNLEVVYEKVAGHAGIEMNEKVDKIANKLAGI